MERGKTLMHMLRDFSADKVSTIVTFMNTFPEAVDNVLHSLGRDERLKDSLGRTLHVMIRAAPRDPQVLALALASLHVFNTTGQEQGHAMVVQSLVLYLDFCATSEIDDPHRSLRAVVRVLAGVHGADDAVVGQCLLYVAGCLDTLAKVPCQILPASLKPALAAARLRCPSLVMYSHIDVVFSLMEAVSDDCWTPLTSEPQEVLQVLTMLPGVVTAPVLPTIVHLLTQPHFCDEVLLSALALDVVHTADVDGTGVPMRLVMLLLSTVTNLRPQFRNMRPEALVHILQGVRKGFSWLMANATFRASHRYVHGALLAIRGFVLSLWPCHVFVSGPESEIRKDFDLDVLDAMGSVLDGVLPALIEHPDVVVRIVYHVYVCLLKHTPTGIPKFHPTFKVKIPACMLAAVPFLDPQLRSEVFVAVKDSTPDPAVIANVVKSLAVVADEDADARHGLLTYLGNILEPSLLTLTSAPVWKALFPILDKFLICGPTLAVLANVYIVYTKTDEGCQSIPQDVSGAVDRVLRFLFVQVGVLPDLDGRIIVAALRLLGVVLQNDEEVFGKVSACVYHLLLCPRLHTGNEDGILTAVMNVLRTPAVVYPFRDVTKLIGICAGLPWTYRFLSTLYFDNDINCWDEDERRVLVEALLHSFLRATEAASNSNYLDFARSMFTRERPVVFDSPVKTVATIKDVVDSWHNQISSPNHAYRIGKTLNRVFGDFDGLYVTLAFLAVRGGGGWFGPSLSFFS